MIMPRYAFAVFSIVVTTLFAPPSVAYDNPPANERLESCDPSIVLTAAKEILGSSKALKEPLEMLPAAFALFQSGEKDNGVFWYYAAQLRTRYQIAFEGGDRGQILAVMMMTIGPLINAYALQDVDKLERIIDRVLKWDKTTPNPYSEKPRNKDIEAQLEHVYSGILELKAKLVAERDDIERNAKAASPEMERMAARFRAPPCQPGKPDPGFVRGIIESEKKAVTEFAENHSSILKQTGTIKHAYVASYKDDIESGLPGRYTLSIDGTIKDVYAEVNVSRSGEKPNFVLACVTHLSTGQRDSSKDVCAP